jgi:hypothetical protein
MRLTNGIQIDKFIDTVNECKGDVWLESIYGDKYNLKSKMNQYVAIYGLIGCESDKLELFCSLPEDEQKFFKFFNENPEVL